MCRQRLIWQHPLTRLRKGVSLIWRPGTSLLQRGCEGKRLCTLGRWPSGCHRRHCDHLVVILSIERTWYLRLMLRASLPRGHRRSWTMSQGYIMRWLWTGSLCPPAKIAIEVVPSVWVMNSFYICHYLSWSPSISWFCPA